MRGVEPGLPQQQVLLAADVVIEPRLGKPARLGNVLHRSRLIPLLIDQPRRGLQDHLMPLPMNVRSDLRRSCQRNSFPIPTTGRILPVGR
jgi:hypothetical protein